MVPNMKWDKNAMKEINELECQQQRLVKRTGFQCYENGIFLHFYTTLPYISHFIYPPLSS